jgi:hypothetical protein
VVDGLKEGKREGPTQGTKSEISFQGWSRALELAQGRLLLILKEGELEFLKERLS